jgi:hypothetical protein
MNKTELPEGINTPLLGEHEAALAQLSDEKREHFLYLIHVLMDCYKSERNKAIVLMTEGEDDPDRISVMAINADQSETEKLIDMLCVFGKIGSEGGCQVMN